MSTNSPATEASLITSSEAAAAAPASKAIAPAAAIAPAVAVFSRAPWTTLPKISAKSLLISFSGSAFSAFSDSIAAIVLSRIESTDNSSVYAGRVSVTFSSIWSSAKVSTGSPCFSSCWRFSVVSGIERFISSLSEDLLPANHHLNL